MKVNVTITDVTRMQEGRVCVAGYLPDDTCIRPVVRRGGIMEEWLSVRGQAIIRPFAVVTLDVQERRPEPPHTEDRYIDPGFRRGHGLLTPGQRKTFLPSIEDECVEAIFGADICAPVSGGWYVCLGDGLRSLGTIRPVEILRVTYSHRFAHKWDYRLSFVDRAHREYQLVVNDLSFRAYLDHLRVQGELAPISIGEMMAATLRANEVFLRIGLARGWAKHPDRCHLQITGVYTFPDYLDGRCYADFAHGGDRGYGVQNSREDELPF